MFTSERDERWLHNLWDRCCTAPFLISVDECQRLAARFIGCNLVMDLASLLYNVLHNHPVPLMPAITTATVHSWLANPPGPNFAQMLVSPAARLELEGGPESQNPWRRINLWLGREVLLRSLRAPPGSAWPHAQETFRGSFPGGPLGVPVCRGRTGQAEEAFRLWWEEAAGVLTQLLAGRLWPRRDEYSLRNLAGLLAVELDPKTHRLVALTQSKNNQSQACNSQSRRWHLLPRPVPQEWVGRLTGRLLDAETTGEGLRLTADDVEYLERLLIWLRDNQQALRPAGGAWEETVLWRHAMRRRQQTVPAADVSALVDAWEEVGQVITALQGAFPQAARFLARDLFSFPVPEPADFASWIKRSRFFWP
jgi:hypothetical protein